AVAIRHADGEARHVVHEEVGEVLGRHHDERLRARGDELLAQAAEGGVEGLAQRRIGHARAPGDARRVAADAGEDQAHTPATFSSICVVMVYTPARTCPCFAMPSRIAWMYTGHDMPRKAAKCISSWPLAPST